MEVPVRALFLAVLFAVSSGSSARAQSSLPRLTGHLAVGSVLAGCDQAGVRLDITTSTHLDPSCVYTEGLDIRASNVVLDCRGATLDSPINDGRGIGIRSPTDAPLTNVVVRNCIVQHFQNNVRVTRQGFKDLLAGEEYDTPFSNILIENSRFLESRASGIFVDGYVTGVTLRYSEVARSGSVGVYLEAGSKDNVLKRNDIHDNGYGDVVPGGVPIDLGGGTIIHYISTGREGIAVDGSRNNRISRNRIAGNSAGGIFLYKNCGEDQTRNGHWVRRYGADGNFIDRNTISDGPNGVWFGARMSENQFFMDCSDLAYVNGGGVKIHEDFAKTNVLRRNAFLNIGYGVRVEDDFNRVDRNRFASSDAGHQAILIGTKYRGTVLGRPVTDTFVRGNRADIAGNGLPYGWIYDEQNTTFASNRAHGVTVGLFQQTPPVVNPFLFAISIVP